MDDREEDFLGFCAEKGDESPKADPLPVSPKKRAKKAETKNQTESMTLAALGGEDEEMKEGPVPETKFMSPQ
jgi:hypothetical protein